MDPTKNETPKPRPVGRPRKLDKRVSLSIRIDPDDRSLLAERAKQNDRSLSEETGDVIKHALNGDAGPPVTAPARSGQPASPENDPLSKVRALAEGLSFFFDKQLAGLLMTVGFAMQDAALDSVAWSQDVVERTRRFPVVKGDTGSTLRQIEELGQFLRQSLPRGKLIRPLDEPYVFAQMVAAANFIFETIAPDGDPSPPAHPRGLNPALADALMRNMGVGAGASALRSLTRDDVDKLPHVLLSSRAWLSEAELSRLKQTLADESPLDPTEGQTADG